MKTTTKAKVYDVVVVGGGAAGVGVAIALRHAGIENFIVLERHTVGASFAAWPAETRFIPTRNPSILGRRRRTGAKRKDSGRSSLSPCARLS